MPGGMPNAMPGAMLNRCSEQSTQRTYVRTDVIQASSDNSPDSNVREIRDRNSTARRSQTVPLTMLTQEWYRLASIAEARGTRVADMVAGAVRGLIDDGHADELAAELARARAAGFRAPRREKPKPFDLELWRRRHTFCGEEWAEVPRWSA